MRYQGKSRYLECVERIIPDQGENGGRRKRENDLEGIVGGLICGAEFEKDEVHCCNACSNEEDLHDAVVQRNVLGEEVNIACGVCDREQDLAFA